MLITHGDARYEEADVQVLDEVLTQASPTPSIVRVIAESGTLGVGIGHPSRSVVLYSGTEGPALHGLGDADAGDSCNLLPALAFDGRAFYDRCAVPREVAIAAAHEFLTSGGKLPDVITWESEPIAST